MLARDLTLAAATGGWLFGCHTTTARGVALIREAKARGVHVTAEVTPHHLALTDEWVAGRRQLLLGARDFRPARRSRRPEHEG